VSLADSSSVVFTSSRFSLRGLFAFDHLAFLENLPLGPAYGLRRRLVFFLGVCGGGGGGVVSICWYTTDLLPVLLLCEATANP